MASLGFLRTTIFLRPPPTKFAEVLAAAPKGFDSEEKNPADLRAPYAPTSPLPDDETTAAAPYGFRSNSAEFPLLLQEVLKVIRVNRILFWKSPVVVVDGQGKGRRSRIGLDGRLWLEAGGWLDENRSWLRARLQGQMIEITDLKISEKERFQFLYKIFF